MRDPTTHHSRTGKLAQSDGLHRCSDSPRTPISPTIDQFLGGDSSRWSPLNSPTFRKEHDIEEDHSHHQKKSVLTKVKERAKKLRHSLSKKKHSEDGNTTPSWGVTLEDEEGGEEEDAEYLGAPMYESELAPEGYRENARQHPRAVPVIPENHVLTSSVTVNNHGAGLENEQQPCNGQEENEPAIEVQEENEKPSVGQEENEKPPSPYKRLTETVTERLAPAYATVSDATLAIASKIKSLTVSSPTAAVSETDQKNTSPSAQIWDKGVSVKEYILNKFEPGEDDKALSRVITEAMSPRRSPRDGTGAGKMKVAVTSTIWNEEPATMSPQIPISTNAYDVVEEETHGRILQAN